MRSILIVVSSVVLALILAPVAEADEPKATIVNGDTFPAALGYAVLGACSAAGALLSGVIGKLWYGAAEERKQHQAEIDALKKEHQVRIDALKDDCREEVDRLRDRLELEQKERREEAEKLLREQKDIMRETMTTCGSVSQALGGVTTALEKLVEGA